MAVIHNTVMQTQSVGYEFKHNTRLTIKSQALK